MTQKRAAWTVARLFALAGLILIVVDALDRDVGGLLTIGIALVVVGLAISQRVRRSRD